MLDCKTIESQKYLQNKAKFSCKNLIEEYLIP